MWKDSNSQKTHAQAVWSKDRLPVDAVLHSMKWWMDHIHLLN